MSSTQEVQHLWAACDDQLQRALHNAGGGRINNSKDLKAMIKQIAVKRRNNLVNIVTLQQMGQQQNETVTSYSTRLNGQADVCDLLIECPDCHHDVSFKEKVLMYQFVR